METCWSHLTRVSLSVPSGAPTSCPWARLDCTMAETPELSSEMRRTVDCAAEVSLICPMTPVDVMTGMPMASPEPSPLSMVMVELQEVVDWPMTVAPVDVRL